MIDAGPVIIRPATVSDAAALSAFGREQFARTFAPDNEAANLDAYLGAHFGESVQRGELADSRVHVLVAEVDGAWRTLARGTTMGIRRILRFPLVSASRVRVVIARARACPAIAEVGLHLSAR